MSATRHMGNRADLIAWPQHDWYSCERVRVWILVFPDAASESRHRGLSLATRCVDEIRRKWTINNRERVFIDPP